MTETTDFILPKPNQHHAKPQHPEQGETHAQTDTVRQGTVETLSAAEKIESCRLEIRSKLAIFTDSGRGRRLIEHDRQWRRAMENINLLSLNGTTDPAEIEALGEKAKNLVIAARQNHPNMIEEKIVAELRTFADSSPEAKKLVLEEFERIGKQNLGTEIFGETGQEETPY